MVTCLVTVRLHGVNIRHCLVDTPDKLGAGWPAARLDDLLPAYEKAPE